MNIKHQKKLVDLLDKKIELLTSYKQISNEIIDSDIEKISEKFAQRQLLISEIDEVSSQIKKIVSKQQQDIKDVLNSILTYKENNPVIEYKEIYDKAVEIKKILMLISHCEAKIKNHIEEIKLEMKKSMKKNIDKKKVVDYYNTVTKKVIHGTNFDTLK